MFQVSIVSEAPKNVCEAARVACQAVSVVSQAATPGLVACQALISLFARQSELPGAKCKNNYSSFLATGFAAELTDAVGEFTALSAHPLVGEFIVCLVG